MRAIVQISVGEPGLFRGIRSRSGKRNLKTAPRSRETEPIAGRWWKKILAPQHLCKPFAFIKHKTIIWNSISETKQSTTDESEIEDQDSNRVTTSSILEAATSSHLFTSSSSLDNLPSSTNYSAPLGKAYINIF